MTSQDLRDRFIREASRCIGRGSMPFSFFETENGDFSRILNVILTGLNIQVSAKQFVSSHRELKQSADDTYDLIEGKFHLLLISFRNIIISFVHNKTLRFCLY